MTHAFVTVALPFGADQADAVDGVLEGYGPRLRGSGDLRDALRGQGIHFMSITVVRGGGGEPAHLLFEVAVDGSEGEAFRIIAARLAPVVQDVFKAAGIAANGPLDDVLAKHRIRTGQGLFDVPGLDFSGTPEMSLSRILDEGKLARAIRDYLDDNPLSGANLDRLRTVRAHVAGIGHLSALLKPEPLQPLPAESGLSLGDPVSIVKLVLAGAWKFFWPVMLPLAAAIVAMTVVAAGSGFTSGVMAFVTATIAALILFLALVVVLAVKLRRLEQSNQPDDSLPDGAVLADVVAHEDWSTQNHLAGVSIMQPGLLRGLYLRLAFWVIGQMAARRFRPGFLGDIGTIHFARWVLLPKTNKLLFFSNFGGSWESYLEDFITKAATGLTGVWSNTIGFPRTEYLFTKGATDGDRFKRWARRQQRPTRFWYSAYPHLTTTRIRTNAAIRQGLASASTEDEAEAWFGLIGSASRPAGVIETGDVQTLLFGGLKNHPSAACLILSLPAEAGRARDWLRAVEPIVTFGDSPPPDRVHVLGVSASGLRKLNLAEATLAQFAMPFLQGMRQRSSILADTGDDQPKHWLWGGDRPCDAALNVYCDSAGTLAQAIASIAADLKARGGDVLYTVALPAQRTSAANGDEPAFPREPFGFADGISQPIIRGTRRWVRAADRIHSVEPGEFLFGYPDNRGDYPFSPAVPAAADPQNILTVADPKHSLGRLQPSFAESGAGSDRDFGRNGSFLVIRQLEQDVAAFDGYLASAAQAHSSHPAVPQGLAANQLAEWIGAKMVGRWKDGTSLVRFPRRPGSGWGGNRTVQPDNEFLLGAEDPMGLRCPFGAHIRRSNPRDSFSPGSEEQLGIVNRHRLLRRGRRFEASEPGDPGTTHQGILFMCLCAGIERQFEFTQQTWAMALQFHGLENEVDPLLSRGGRLGRLTIPTANGPLLLKGFPDFVRVRGGEYFFMPGRRALRYLAN